MSFILDALKKAESERSRASGPVLVDVRIAPPRRRLPAWAWVLGGVLLANLAVLAWLLLRKPAVEAMATVAAPAVNAAAASTDTAASAAAMAAPVIPMPDGIPPTAAPPAASASRPATAPALNGPPADLDSLPTARDLQASGVALPQLQLNLHVYDPAPAERYVLLNGVHLMEGDFTPDGIKVEVIVERGVVLEAHGRRFLLPAGG